MPEYDRYTLKTGEKIAVFLLTTSALAFIGEIFYGTFLLFALGIPFSVLTFKWAEKYLMTRRKERLRRESRDLMNVLSSSFAAGRHMRESLKEAYEELEKLYDRDDDIMRELRNMQKRMEDGERDIDVLSSLSERAGIEELTTLTLVFRATRETGGDMARCLMETASLLTEKMRIEEEIRSATLQKKTEGIVISLMPVAIIIFLKIISPGYIEILYGNLTGIVIMTLAVISVVISFLMIRKITEINV